MTLYPIKSLSRFVDRAKLRHYLNPRCLASAHLLIKNHKEIRS
jgi:hypothetical protein